MLNTDICIEIVGPDQNLAVKSVGPTAFGKSALSQSFVNRTSRVIQHEQDMSSQTSDDIDAFSTHIIL